MKKKIISIFFFLVFSSCSEEPEVPVANLNCSDIKIEAGVAFYQNLKFSGSCITFYPESLSKDEIRTYKNGLRDGVWVKFYENTNLRYIGVAKKGEITGKYRSYYDNGSLEDSGKMYKGYKDGIWYKFDIYNQLRRKTQFNKGRILRDEKFDEYVY